MPDRYEPPRGNGKSPDEMPLPELSEEPARLVDLFLSAGRVTRGPEGPLPLGWKDLEAWAELTMPNASPGDMEFLHSVSRAYVMEYEAAFDPSRPSPLLDEEEAATEQKTAIAQGMRGMLGGVVVKKGPRKNG